MLVRHFRRFARSVEQDLWPTPERSVLRALERHAAREPRRTPGQIAIAPYRFEYADAMSTWAQWDAIFIRDSLAFDTGNPQPRILDCGANIGMASLYFRQRCPHASITAFEADPALAAICRRNLAAADASDVVVKNAAVWTAGGTLEFVCEGADSGALASLNPTVSGAMTKVAAERLAEWLTEPVDLLKLDIEGAELPVLQDCGDALGHVRAMTIDVHEFDSTRRQTGAIFDLLADAGFVFDMRDLAPIPWRSAPAVSPFADPSPTWVATIRAWRR